MNLYYPKEVNDVYSIQYTKNKGRSLWRKRISESYLIFGNLNGEE